MLVCGGFRAVNLRGIRKREENKLSHTIASYDKEMTEKTQEINIHFECPLQKEFSFHVVGAPSGAPEPGGREPGSVPASLDTL